MEPRTIGSLVELVRGNTYKSALLDQDGPYLLGLASIERNGGFRTDKLRTYGGPSAEKHLVYPGDMYVSLKDLTQSAYLLGSIARVPENIALGRMTQDTVKLQFTDNEYPQDFFYWVLRTPQYKAYCKNRAIGTTNLSLSREDFLSFTLPAVTNTRSEIVKLLERIEDKLEINRQINQTLEQMAQAMFKSWFVDFDPVKAKMNGEQPKGMDAATASLFPEKLVESELGLIPEGWEASKLEDLVDIASSKRVFAKEYLKEGVPFYRGKEITELSKGNSVTPEIYISEERYQELKDKAGAPKKGDILITSVGTIGNTYLVDLEDKFYFKDGNLTWVRGYKGEEIPYFLMEWFNSAVGKCAVENIKIGSTQQAITIKSLNGIKLVSPPNDIHMKFTQLIEPLYRKHRANIKQSKALANLRDTLLPKLLSGEIDLENVQVKEVKAIVE